MVARGASNQHNSPFCAPPAQDSGAVGSNAWLYGSTDPTSCEGLFDAGSHAARPTRTTHAARQVLPRGDIPRAIGRTARRWRDEQRGAADVTVDAVFDAGRSEKLLRRALAVEAKIPGLVDHDLHTKRHDVRDGERHVTVAARVVLDKISEADPKRQKLLGLVGTKFGRSETDLMERAPEAITGAGVVLAQLSRATPSSGATHNEIQVTSEQISKHEQGCVSV